MLAFVDSQFVPGERAVVSVFDRGFLYGDGLFETVRVYNGKLFRWGQHLERLQRGAAFLRICLPLAPEALREVATQLIERNHMPDSILRLTLSRGIGVRGYSPKGAGPPSLAMTLHPAPMLEAEHPPRWKLITSSFRLPAGDPLARFKTCNKLPQIIARAEADAAGADEALLLNTDGHVVQASSSNLFWIDDGVVCTPPLVSGILPGVTRATVLELCQSLGLPAREAIILKDGLAKVQGVFLSLSSSGIVEASSLDGRLVAGSPLPGRIRLAYIDLVRRETA